MKKVEKILICKTKRKSNGILGSGHSSWDTGELIVVTEVDRLIEAEDIDGIENCILIPIIRFEK